MNDTRCGHSKNKASMMDLPCDVLPESQCQRILEFINSFKQFSLMSFFFTLDKFPLIYQLGSSGILPQNTKCQKFIMLDI